jgi:hypothetical protein
MSTRLIQLLCVAYAFILVVCLFESKFVMATYWLGAIILNCSIILMGGK